MVSSLKRIFFHPTEYLQLLKNTYTTFWRTLIKQPLLENGRWLLKSHPRVCCDAYVATVPLIKKLSWFSLSGWPCFQ